MNSRLSRQNFIAGFLLVHALGLLLRDALKLDIETGMAMILALLIWGCIHYLFGRRHIAVGGTALGVSILLLAAMHPVTLRWVEYVRYKNPLQLGLSTYVADLLMLEKWPDFVFYAMDAFLQGADMKEQILVFNLLIMAILAIVIGIVVYSSILSKRHYGYFLIPLLFFVQQWFQYAENIQSHFSLYFIGFIMVAGSYARERSLRSSKASAYGITHFATTRYYGAYLFVLGVIIIMLSNFVLFFTPVDEINTSIGEIVPNILDMRTGYKRQSMTMFTFRQTIYQPYGERLGGPVIQEENPVLLRVWSDNAGAYLRGRVNTKYTGSSWKADHIHYSNNNDYSDQTGTPLTHQDEYEITVVPEGINTRTLFAPLGIKDVNLDRSKVFANPDGAMYYRRDSFEGALDIYTIHGVDYSMRLEDRELYLALPESYDEKVIAKALEITEGLESDYDKMEALKSWLRGNYPYDLEPDLPPGDVDFVSYFLFEEESGYCTYFASALAVMGRAVDVPTRYVEGFLMPRARESDGSYAVRADRAHAWTEAYIEGEGWRIFEATPAYSSLTARLNEDEIQESEEATSAIAEDQSQAMLDAKEEFLDMEMGNNRDYVPVEKPDYSREILYGFISILLLGLVVLTYILQRVRSFFDKGTNHRLAVRWIYYLEDLIEIESDTMTPAEKLEKFMSAQEGFDAGMKPQAYDIIDKVNVVLYSGMDVNDEILEQIKTAVYQIEGETKGRLNRMKYWLDRRSS